MRRRACLVTALVAALAALAGAARAEAPALKAGVFEPPRAAPAFALQGSDGAALNLARFKGRLVALVFGYTHCPAVCPTTLANLAQARQALGAQAAAVQVVYVTVDPERDDAARIREYLAGFDRSFIGGTAAPAVLADMRQRYGVTAEKVPMSGGDYGINHSSSVYLIDREGRLRALMPFGHGPSDFAHDLKLLLAAP